MSKTTQSRDVSKGGNSLRKGRGQRDHPLCPGIHQEPVIMENREKGIQKNVEEGTRAGLTQDRGSEPERRCRLGLHFVNDCL